MDKQQQIINDYIQSRAGNKAGLLRMIENLKKQVEDIDAELQEAKDSKIDVEAILAPVVLEVKSEEAQEVKMK